MIIKECIDQRNLKTSGENLARAWIDYKKVYDIAPQI